MGALAAGLFQAADISRVFYDLRGKLILLGGIVLILVGLALLKVLPLPAALSTLALGQSSFIGRRIPPLLRSSSPGSKLILGSMLAFMPCCLSWAMVVTAATTHSPLQGFLTMIAFGIGTLPALLFTGLFASFLSVKARFLGEQAAALSIVIMGLILILEGVGIIE
jgi:sulfite exporter TauE/SafE